MNKRKIMIIALLVFIMLVIIKVVWVTYATTRHGSFDNEKKDLIHRANYLTSMVCTTPQDLLNEIP